MDQDRWITINRIFHAALEVEQSQRYALVAAESGDDTELKAEVEILLQADADVGSYLESPLMCPDSLLASHSPLVPGDVLCDRFRIVREIAEGGMGHVFEAFDSELAVHVALKVIRPEIASNAEAVARFRQEVRLARSITHPNICRTFDIEREVRTSNGQRTELVFLTMEFLPGETLANRLQRDGPLPMEEALVLSRQIAAALQAAHSLGIVHRDMKPANIMLVSPENSSPHISRAVVTDFGLARLDPVLFSEGLSSFTNPKHLVGTLAYMAPEQLEGTAVSPATDIYAFGLILFEMLTGKRAFPSNSLLSGIAQRLRGTVSLDQMLEPRTPATWRQAIKDCLAVDPSDRPRDANRVLAMLEEDPRKLLPRLWRSAFFSGKVLLRISLWSAISLAVVALSVAGLRLYSSRTASQVTTGALVYLTQVRNETGERSIDSLTDLFQASISQSPQVNLLEQGRIGDILQQMTKFPETSIDAGIAREIAMRAGAVRVIFVTVSGSPGAYRLNVDIQQPDNTPARYREHWTKSFAWQTSATPANSTALPPDLLAAVRAASDWIRHEAGESANDIARLDTPPEDVTTDNWQALMEFSNAERFNTLRRRDDALNALQNAVRLDSSFALAYSRMGDLLNSVDRWNEGDEAYVKALEADDERRLTRRERDRVRGIYSLDTWDFATAESVFRDETVYYNDDYLAWFYRGAALVMLDRNPEALTCFERAAQLRRGAASALVSAASADLMLNDKSGAQEWIDNLIREKHPDEATWVKANADLLEGQFSKSLRGLEKLKTAGDPLFLSRSYDYVAHLASDRGDYKLAATNLTQGIEYDIASGSRAEQSQKLMDRAWIECRLKEYDLCISDERGALKQSDSFVAVRAASTVLGSALSAAPAAAVPKLKKALFAVSEQMPKPDSSNLSKLSQMQLRGEILLAEGRSRAAIDDFRKVVVLDAPADPQEYLARALLLTSAHTKDEALARSLRLEAQDTYARSVLREAFLEYRVSFYPPGFYGDALESWLLLALRNGTPAKVILPQLARYAELRPAMFHQSATLQEAWHSLAPPTQSTTIH